MHGELSLTVKIRRGAAGTPFWVTAEDANSRTAAAATNRHPTESSDIARDWLELERERANRDANLRERELALKAREIQLKEGEQRTSAGSPLLVAAVGAVLALFTNVVVTYLQGASNQKIEKARAKTNLIMEATKTGNQDEANKNLLFFIEIGLIGSVWRNGAISYTKRCKPLISRNIAGSGGLRH